MCKVIYEDNHLLVAEKPPNMLTQADATGDDCLLEAMKRYIGEKYQKPGAVFLGLVHRLDRPVGGLVAFARTSKAASRLSEQLRAHKMEREYLAVAEGSDIPDSQALCHALLKDEATGNVRVVPTGTPGSQEARLRYRVLARNTEANTALLHVQLETGRKHQIRVQLAASGHPLRQDMRYGHGKAGEPIALWGAVLRLTHPTRSEEMTFQSPPKGKAFEAYAPAIEAFLAKTAKGGTDEHP